MITYSLALNCTQRSASRIDPRAVQTAVRARIEASGLSVSQVGCQVNNIEGSFLSNRSVVVVSVATGEERLDATKTRILDTIAVDCLRGAASAQWSVNGIIGGLDDVGTSDSRVSLLGDVTSVSREVRPGVNLPSMRVSQPLSTTQVVASTNTDAVGTITASLASNTASDIGSALGEYKVPLTVAGIAVAAAAGAYVVWKVTR